MAINREISQFSNFVSVDDNTKKVSISTSFDIGGDSVISGDVTVGTATTGVVARNDGTLNVSGTATFQNDVDLGDDNKLKFGDNGKFKIYHDGSLGYNIVKGEGSSDEASLYFITNEVLFYDQSGNNFKAKFTDGGPVSLFHNGTKTFETVGSGISISSGTASTATIFGPENIIIDPSPVGVGTTSGNVYIKGDLYVDGTRTEINSTTLTIDDLNVVVASGATNSIEADGAGIEVDGASATLQYDSTGDKWVFNKAPYYNTNRLLTTADQGTGNGIDADTLDGQEGTYYLDYTNFTNTPPDVRWFETAVGIWTSSSVGIGTTNPTSTLMVDGTLNVSGVSTFQDSVVLTGVGKSLVVGPSSHQLILEHDPLGAGVIRQNNDLFLCSPGIVIGALDVTATGNRSADFIPNGSVTLYHYGNQKFQTTSSGITVTGRTQTQRLNVTGISTFKGDVNIGTGGTVAFFDISSGNIGIASTQPTSTLDLDGTLNVSGISTFQDDVKFPSAGTNGLGNILYDKSTGEFKFNGSGADKIKSTYTYGGDSFSVYQNSITQSLIQSNSATDLYIAFNGSTYITDQAGSNKSAVFNGTGAAELYNNNSKKLETTGYGVTVTGGLNVSGISTLADIVLTGSANSITFDPSTNNNKTFFIRGEGNGNATIENDDEMYVSSTHLYIQKPGGTTTMAEFIEDGAVKLNHNNSTKLQTHDYGIDVTGRVETDTLNVSGIATFGSDLDINADVNVSGIATAAEFVGGGSDLRNLSGTHLVSYASASDISNSAVSISGISTYNEVGILSGTYASDNNDQFGESVACSADGKTIVVGAGGDGTSGNDTGLVYVFDREGNNFNEVGILTGTYAQDNNDNFGSSVATSADGKTIVVGANGDEHPNSETNSGVVYVFDREGNNFNEVGILTGSYASDQNDYFGSSVATSADGKTIVVGARMDGTSGTDTGLVYVFDRDGNNFNEVGILTGTYATDFGDFFGNSVTCSADGKTIVVGASGDGTSANDTGLVYVYDRVGNTFNEVGILTGTYAIDDNDYFGSSVATSADGKTIVVGASQDEVSSSGIGTYGVVYVFDRDGNNFNEVGILTSSDSGLEYKFGDQVECSADGKTIVVGAFNAEISSGTDPGLVYVFNREGNNFNEVGILTGTYAQDNNEAFGGSIAISADGKTIIVGAYNDEIGNPATGYGLVYVFDQERETYVFSDANGNIGIGSAQPTAKLDVDGTLNVSGISTFQDDVSIGTGGTTAFFDISSGRVGIGITNPTKLLDIDGTLGVSGISYFTNAVSINPSNSSTIPLNFESTSGFIPQISFKRTPTARYGIHYFIPAGQDARAIHQLDSGSNFEIGLSGGSFIVGDNSGGGFPVTTKAFEVKEDAETYLTHNHNKKLETTGYGVTVTGGLNVSGVSTFSNRIDANNVETDALDVSGIATAAEFVGRLRNLSGTHLVSYASASNIANSAESISGISTYNQVGILTGSYASDYQDWFGSSVATSADGKTIVVGAKTDKITNVGASSYGIVYVFDREGNNFTELDQLTGFGYDFSDNFGESVACSADGETIFVGAIQDETPGSGTQDYGLVHIFDRKGNQYHHVGFLTGSYASESDDRFGQSVACSADGKTIVVGARGDEFVTGPYDDFGFVYVFDRVGNDFNQVGILTGAGNSNFLDYFGSSVACSADGKTIAVGAANDETSGTEAGAGVVYVFDRVGNDFNEVGILTGTYATDGDISNNVNGDRFGDEVAMSADGKTIFVGAVNDEINPSGIGTYGVVYVFDRVGNNFNEVGILTGSYASDDGDYFGKSIRCSADGKTIVVGAPYDEINPSGIGTYGVVYIFNREGNNFNEVSILTGSHASDDDRFGDSVAISADGKNIIVGAHRDELPSSSSESGVVYVYDQERETYVFSDVNGNIGIGSTTPTAKLDVNGTLKVNDVYHVQAGVSTFTASAGVAYTANSYPSSDFVNAEYTLFFEHTSGIQSQKVLVMDDGSTAYSQEYAIMTSNDLLVSVGATVKSNNVELWVTPETGVSGTVTYKFTREALA